MVSERDAGPPAPSQTTPRASLPTRAVTAACACLWAASALGCYPDQVAPGYYGSPDDAGAETAPVATGEPPAGGSSSGAGIDPDAGDHALESGDGGESPAAKPDAMGPTGCDLTGRWIATEREVATGLGAQEAAHIWLYFELAQMGQAGTVTRGLDCGESVRGISSASANVDYPKTWPALLTKALQTGRKFTSTPGGSGCAVAFEKRYFAFGASASFDDPTTTMPTVSEQATSTSPGWEDWDGDGNPGYTMNVTGLATGQIYVATRRWNTWSGTIDAGASSFELPDDWGSETDLFGYSGSSLLTEAASGTRDNDASLHFVDFARLGAAQATGDDATTCAAIRSLASSLTPRADN